MNKYQEAIKGLTEFIHSELDGKRITRMLNEHIGYIETLKELVDKETPIKTVCVETEPNAYYGICESCGSGIRLGKHYDNEKEKWVKECYCPHCGQKLYWRGENEK